MLPKRLSLPPMCQPTEARLTHPQLPTRLVSFLFDLGGLGSVFILAFSASGFPSNLQVSRFMNLRVLWCQCP